MTNISTQKIDNSRLEIFGIVITPFSIDDKEEKF